MFNSLKKAVRKLKGKPEKDFENMVFSDADPFELVHLKDKRLYSDNDYALNALREGTKFEPEYLSRKTFFHCYWYGDFGRKQAFSIKSFLCTQNLEQCHLILWLDGSNGFQGHEENIYLKELLPFIEVRAYDPLSEIQDTPWKKRKDLADQDNNLAKRSDAFRFLVLYKYGGVYFDLDVMFLKDFDKLLDLEFCYAWEKQSFANSAVLNLKRKSDLSSYIMKKSMDKHTVLPWVIFQYSDLELKDLCILPCAFFDPVWQETHSLNSPISDFPMFFQPFDEEFKNRLNISSYKDFFPGCYTYHWHNHWKVKEEENSFFGIFEREFDEIIAIRSLH